MNEIEQSLRQKARSPGRAPLPRPGGPPICIRAPIRGTAVPGSRAGRSREIAASQFASPPGVARPVVRSFAPSTANGGFDAATCQCPGLAITRRRTYVPAMNAKLIRTVALAVAVAAGCGGAGELENQARALSV